jgi:hypothetical protein
MALQSLADALAARDASAPGAAMARVTITVTGVGSLGDYATVLGVLEAQPTIRELSVLGVQGQTLRLQASLRGDVSALGRVLLRDGRLQVDAANPTGDAGLRLRLGK